MSRILGNSPAVRTPGVYASWIYVAKSDGWPLIKEEEEENILCLRFLLKSRSTLEEEIFQFLNNIIKEIDMYYELQHVPNEVTVEEMNTFISGLLLWRIKGIGFDPIITPKGKTFYFQGPKHMSSYDIINKLKLKYVRGQRLLIYPCKNIDRVTMLKVKKRELFTKPATVSKNKEQTDAQNSIIMKTCKALFSELFDRYPGLDELNTKSNNVLGYEIYSEVTKRVTKVRQNNTETNDYQVLTKEYRSAYPHDTDLALVELCHKKCDDTPLPPEDVLAVDTLALEYSSRPREAQPKPVPDKKIGWATTYYSAQISKHLRLHIESLVDKCGENPTEEEKATVLVRKHLKATTNGLDLRVKSWMASYLKYTQHALIRVYGIPRLPDKNNLTMLITPRGATTQMALSGSRNIPHNCVVFTVYRDRLDELLALTGNSLDGCTLLVRMHNRNRSHRQARQIRAIQILMRAAADPTDGDEWEDL